MLLTSIKILVIQIRPTLKCNAGPFQSADRFSRYNCIRPISIVSRGQGAIKRFSRFPDTKEINPDK